MRRLGICLLVLLGMACAASAAPARPAAAPTAPAAANTPSAPATSAPAPATSTPRPLQAVLFALPGLNANFLPILVADEKGFYRQAGVEPSIQVMDSATSIAGAATGEVHYLGPTTSVMGAIMAGQALREVAFINAGSFLLYGDATLGSIGNLKGKVVYEASRAGLQDYLLRTMLKANGLDPEHDVSYVFGAEQASLAALLTGQVHAAIAQLPVPLEAERQGFKIYGNTADFARFPTAALGTSVERIATRPDEVQGVIRATLQGLQYLKAHESEAAEIAVRRLEVSADDAPRIVTLLRPSWIDNGMLTDAEIQAVIDERKAAMNVTGDFAPSALVDYRPLTQVQKELGLAR